jgi:hypothetical protein
MAKQAFKKVLDEHRRRLARISERGSVDRLKTLYDRAQEELAAKIRRSVPGRQRPFTHAVRQAVLAQVEDGQAQIAARMSAELGEASREAQVEGLRSASSWIVSVEKAATGIDITLPIDEAARFWGVINGRRQSLLRAHRESMANYGSEVVSAMEDRLALSLVQAETTDEAIDGILDVSKGTAADEWWKAERIVRTETAAAYNQSLADGVAEVAAEIDDMRLRWTEYVSDDGDPLDDRVGSDSIAMHAQVARPGEGWIMPPNADGVSEGMLGRRFFAAPARPNGREVLSPWRPSLWIVD